MIRVAYRDTWAGFPRREILHSLNVLELSYATNVVTVLPFATPVVRYGGSLCRYLKSMQNFRLFMMMVPHRQASRNFRIKFRACTAIFKFIDLWRTGIQIAL